MDKAGKCLSNDGKDAKILINLITFVIKTFKTMNIKHNIDL